MGRTLYYFIQECIGYNEKFAIKGFIDDNLEALDSYSGYPPIISSIQDYQPVGNDVFVCSIGNVRQKRACVELILSRNGKFDTLIHRDAMIRPSAKIGEGCIIATQAVVGADAVVGNYSLIQGFAIIGHDVKIGSYCRVDSRVVCVGGVVINDNVTIHTSSVISHKVVIEKNATIGACSFVIKKVKEGNTVFGNPAKVL